MKYKYLFLISIIACSSDPIRYCENEEAITPGTGVNFNSLQYKTETKCAKIYYCVEIDSSFSADETNRIKLALKDWEESTKYTINFSKPSGCFKIIKQDIPFFRRYGCGDCIAFTNDNIYINKDIACGSRVFNVAVRHELGHMIGLDHITDNKSVMYSKYSLSDLPNISLQTPDIQKFIDVYSCHL